MTTLKQRFASESDVVGAWLSIGHPTVAEVTASQGFDFVLVDTEHTPLGLETVENMSRGVDAVEGETETVVRVPSADPVRIKRVLDIGVAGIMVPMVETASDARQVVEATRYPPNGIRGVASGRAAEYGDEFKQYVESADDSITVVVQIETQTGLDNAADIAAVDGVDAVFVGPADLSANLGVFAEWENDRLNEAIDRVVAAGERTDVPVGTFVVDPDDIEMRVDQGFDYLIVGKDTSHLSSANEAVRERYEAAKRGTTSVAED
ncbi:4-hydroxy-2-oxovalerate aldolase [Halogeometricum pallidum JCM 14848]|uniref:4-hydroxy-2-oxovalerate aldolase n=1 Tax=Halogeometricum pallidum JCM 14848 TaxID=1227487 RepID=M0CXN1_HALPD|nr:aldolase/citrate lyase family protein [Halogeometricum pallidum]ELZ27970.1 4-hydroxy-2-oxovalerate aldolase [Halogeometricum pallidum JCM 14848]